MKKGTIMNNTEQSNESFLIDTTPPIEKSFKQLCGEVAPFQVPELPFPYDNLSVVLDEETLKFHHDKHHKAYVEKLNEAVKTKKNLGSLVLEASNQKDKVRNNAGGHWNHSFFWTVLSGNVKNNKISPEMMKLINKNFKDFKNFQDSFIEEGKNVFGSGWVWLIVTSTGKLKITTSKDQNNPMNDDSKLRGFPVLTMDVWEHAYYLDFQNDRAAYLKALWSVVNWKQVESYYNEAKEMKFKLENL